MPRQNLSKSMRFEVFKRDSFTCQYCGRKAPDVVLEVDHIHPVAKGGTNDLLNLTASCKDCNSGKSDRKLNDTSVLDKQRKQLEDLQERKDQIEMMFLWQKGLLELDSHVIENLSDFWSELIPYSLTDTGRQELKKILKKYSVGEVMSAMKIAVEQYVTYESGIPSLDSVEKAWNYVGRICYVSKAEKDKPYLRELMYIRGIIRKRLAYVDDQLALKLLEQAYLCDASVESLREHAKSVKNWTEWRTDLEEYSTNYKATEVESQTPDLPVCIPSEAIQKQCDEAEGDGSFIVNPNRPIVFDPNQTILVPGIPESGIQHTINEPNTQATSGKKNHRSRSKSKKRF